MKLHDTRGSESPLHNRVLAASRLSRKHQLLAAALLVVGIVAGCATDNVGHSTTTTKKTTDTPTERTTVTETHEKDTTLTPR